MKVKELLSDPSKWAQGHYAYNEAGEQLYGYDHGAVKFCLYGACQLCYGDSPNRYAIEDTLRKTVDALYSTTVISFNDNPNTTHEDIMRVLKAADI